MRLARRWENRVTIRTRLREGQPWIQEPPRGSRTTGEEEDDEGGPPINHDFLRRNTTALYEMFDCWGLRPKVTKEKLQKEACKLKS